MNRKKTKGADIDKYEYFKLIYVSPKYFIITSRDTSTVFGSKAIHQGGSLFRGQTTSTYQDPTDCSNKPSHLC